MVGTNEDILLEIRNLCSGYKRKNILKGIDFLVRKGEFWGLIGPNGSGKTTLLKSITKILPAQKGNVFYNKEDIMKIPAKKLAQNIAVVPQVSVFHFSFTVEDFVLLGRIPYLPRFYLEGKNDYLIAEEAMRLTETVSFRQRRINELSEGEKQRVVIARSLAQKPTLLLLDEPAAHLDIRHQLDVFNLLEKLNREKGITIILVSHDLNLASHYASQLILLNEGRIFAQGSPKQIINEENIWKVYGVKVKVTPGIKGSPLVNLFK
jgi:iron complex transport system ATP-binding protein